ncbi:hypothetical protein GW17_00057318 [Ensete ventricosum]|uniref:Uncharacterized protein n=1 Tax=Ensete ventricosum TaxID=4639 RepID=A0A426YI55_ENSVE|nr:hypothetical protein B296_00035116 [Ensete ventricosum]RWV81275.1 hypothetical protein GW17_00057318 [Ensete ventricosum]
MPLKLPTPVPLALLAEGERDVNADEEVWDGETVCDSTGFLERLRPRCMWRSQYLEPGYASLEQRHFFPSVRRHRPGSGSGFFP